MTGNWSAESKSLLIEYSDGDFGNGEEPIGGSEIPKNNAIFHT